MRMISNWLRLQSEQRELRSMQMNGTFDSGPLISRHGNIRSDCRNVFVEGICVALKLGTRTYSR